MELHLKISQTQGWRIDLRLFCAVKAFPHILYNTVLCEHSCFEGGSMWLNSETKPQEVSLACIPSSQNDY